MPKTLYLLRHAQSAEKQQGQHDRDRELTPLGVKETLQIASYLHQQKIVLDVIYFSIAERARATAQLIADTLKVDHDRVLAEEELFQASVRTFLEFVNQLDDAYHQVMCVGHNPTISYLAEYISNGEIGDMSPAGLAIVKFNTTSWKEVQQSSGELVTYATPSSLSEEE